MGDADQRLRRTTEIQDDGCWLWHGHIDKKSGYGRLTFQGRTIGAHRLAYETWVGPIPTGLHVDHICRVRNCLRPDHLEAVTQAENNRRAWVVANAGKPQAVATIRPRRVPKPPRPKAAKPSETGVRKCGHPYLGSGDCPECARLRAARYREQLRKGEAALPTITCLECGREEPNCAKGMCRRCYTRLYKRATYVPSRQDAGRAHPSTERTPARQPSH